MNNSELLHNLFDRSLEPHQEERLFIELASNDELRTEFKQFMDMEFAVRNDFEAFQPSPESQDKIFGALGISTAAITSGAAAASVLTFGGWIAKYLNYFILSFGSLIFGGLMTFLLMNGADNNHLLNTSENNKQSSEINKSTLAKNNNSQKIPLTESYRIDTVYKDKIIIKYLPQQDRIIYVANDDLARDEIEEIPSFDISESKSDGNYFFINNELQSAKNNFTDLSGGAYNPLETIKINSLFNDKLSFEIKANEDWSLPKADMPRSSYPVFNNTSAALMYKFNEKFQLGADFRQEYFYQEYDGFDDNNKAYNYYQHTNYISAGIIARYSLINDYNTKIFLQPSVSFNQVGIVGRAMIGAEYKIVDQVSVVLGLEGSLLQFNHQGNNFYSPKIGFHYGIRLNP